MHAHALNAPSRGTRGTSASVTICWTSSRARAVGDPITVRSFCRLLWLPPWNLTEWCMQFIGLQLLNMKPRMRVLMGNEMENTLRFDVLGRSNLVKFCHEFSVIWYWIFCVRQFTRSRPPESQKFSCAHIIKLYASGSLCTQMYTQDMAEEICKLFASMSSTTVVYFLNGITYVSNYHFFENNPFIVSGFSNHTNKCMISNENYNSFCLY